MIESVSIPISTCLRRIDYLRTMFLSLDASSHRSHKVVLVTEDDPEELRQTVERWRGKTRLQVIGAVPSIVGFRPVYQFLNIGAAHASEPWIMVPAGDDSYFPRGWEALLDAVDEHQFDREIWVPRYLSVGQDPTRSTCVRPCEYAISLPHCISETDLMTAVESWREPRTVRESAGKRENVSWVHAVIHRDLFDRAGRYIETPPYPDAHDLHLNDALRDRCGVTSVGVNSSVIVNARAGVRLGE